VLIIPFGLMSGYVTVTLGYLLGHAGVNAQGVAALVAVFFIPQTWKFLWAPVVDLTLTRKRWYALSAALCAVGFIALGVIPSAANSLPLLGAIALGASLATTFLAMSVESLMAYGTVDREKGRAGGWFQAGNLGGTGLGGGAGLWMALEAASLMVYKAAALYDAQQPCGAEANAAKYLAGEACFDACQQAVMTHGGYGYAAEYHVERYLRESLLGRIAPITPQLILCYIAERVLGLPKSY